MQALQRRVPRPLLEQSAPRGGQILEYLLEARHLGRHLAAEDVRRRVRSAALARVHAVRHVRAAVQPLRRAAGREQVRAARLRYGEI